MKRNAFFCFILVLALMLCGCANKQPAPTQDTPKEAETASMPLFPGDHPLSLAATQLMTPYVTSLQQVDIQGVPSISHGIPEDMFTLLIESARQQNATPSGGRYVFVTQVSNTHTYQATAMEATSGFDTAATPDPANESPMDFTKMGDYAVQGGGTYHRTYLWDVKEDLSQGSIEIITTLNGESTGHEQYAFCLRDDSFYFVDAATDLAVTLDTLQNSNTFLVAVGRFTPEKAEVIEYHVSSLAEVPAPENLDFEWLKNTVDRISYLCADPENVTFQ